MKTLFFSCLMMLVLTSCEDDLFPVYNLRDYEKTELTGRVLLKDIFWESNAIPAQDATVYLAGNAGADPYLYSIASEKDGAFHLPHQPKENDDLFLVGKSSTSGIPYEGDIKVADAQKDTERKISLILNPKYPGGIIKIKVLGEGASKEPVTGATVFLFTNQKQAATISDSLPSGIIQRAVSNERGIAFFYNLKSGDYYAVGKANKLITNQVKLTVDAEQSQASKISISATELSLQSKPVASMLRVTVRDAPSNDLLSGVSVYLFTSLAQAESVKDDAGARGFIQVLPTSATGQVLFKDIPGGKYFLAVRGQLREGKEIRYILSESVNIPENAPAVIEKPITIP